MRTSPPPQLDKLYYFSQQKVAETVKARDEAVLVLKKLEVRADFGYTDNPGSSGGPGADTSGSFVDDETVWNVGAGWYEKPLDDFSKYFSGENFAGAWESNWLKPFAFVFDRTNASAYVQYGTTVEDPAGSRNFSTERKFTFYVGAKFKVDLREAFLGNDAR